MAIKQLNASWSKKEDRIVLSFNTTGDELFRFWITRFIAKHIIEGAQSMVQKGLETHHSPRTSQVIQEFQKDAIKKQIDFEEEFEGGKKSPLGNDPILVIGLNMVLKKKSINIGFKLVTNQTASFDLAINQLQPLVVLIEKLAQKAEWAIDNADNKNSLINIDADNQLALSKKLH
ncbi:MAG: hypothetical protein JHC80_08720 [Polynucleobacter sp.]|nr:hypothetical protein [Polynucleobacter sp.]